MSEYIRSIIPARPGYRAVYNDSGRVIVGNEAIAWFIEVEVDSGQTVTSADPIGVEGMFSETSNYLGVMLPSGQVEALDATHRSLDALQAALTGLQET